MTASYDRASQAVGNILHMEHVNLRIPEQPPATLFYMTGLRLTRDPYMMVGLTNMWVNIGRCQMHLPSRDGTVQHLRGTVGLVVPDLEAVEAALNGVRGPLADTAFSARRVNGEIEATCPWGNRFRLHGPAPEFGDLELGMPYVELNAPPGSAAGIARFYREIMGAPATVGSWRNAPAATVTVGNAQRLHFRETAEPQPAFDGHHVAIYIADFLGPYEKLIERGLLTVETDAYEWRFQDIVDLDSGEVLFSIEHEVRSLTHPLYARPLVNRNPAQSNRGYRRGQDGFLGRI